MLPVEHPDGEEIILPAQAIWGDMYAIVVYGPPKTRLGRLRNRIRGWFGLDPINQVYYTWFDRKWTEPQ